MTQTLTVPPHERGVVRVFDVALQGVEAESFASDPAAIARALGLAEIDAAYVDVFPVSRLADLGLSTYLSEGHGIPPDRLASDAPHLDALGGYVAVVSSRAFREGGQTLSVGPPLEHVGSYTEERPPVAFGELPAGGAQGLLTGAPQSPEARARGDRPTWILGLAGLAMLLVILIVVWIAA